MRERKAKDKNEGLARNRSHRDYRQWQLIWVLFLAQKRILRRVILSDSMLLKDHPVHCMRKEIVKR